MSHQQVEVAVVGEINIDLILRDVAMPEVDQEKIAADMRFTMGSSSAITAHNLAAIGGKVGFIGKAGMDAFGDYMVRQLSAAGVDTSQIIRDPKLKTGATVVLANPAGTAALTYMGAMTALTIEDMNWDYIRQARHMHMGCFFLQTGIRRNVAALFARAKEYGLTTSLDTNWDPEEQWDGGLRETLAFTDVFLPNEDEAMRIAGKPDIEATLAELGRLGNTIVVKRGKKGASAIAAGKRLDVQALDKPVTVVETTGAGDSFNAGFISQFVQGKSLESCIRFGNACGMLAVTEMGGTGAFVDRRTVAAKLEQILS